MVDALRLGSVVKAQEHETDPHPRKNPSDTVDVSSDQGASRCSQIVSDPTYEQQFDNQVKTLEAPSVPADRNASEPNALLIMTLTQGSPYRFVRFKILMHDWISARIVRVDTQLEYKRTQVLDRPPRGQIASGLRHTAMGCYCRSAVEGSSLVELTRPEDAADVADMRKAAFAMLGRASIPPRLIAITKGEDMAVPSARPSAGSS